MMHTIQQTFYFQSLDDDISYLFSPTVTVLVLEGTLVLMFMIFVQYKTLENVQSHV